MKNIKSASLVTLLAATLVCFESIAHNSITDHKSCIKPTPHCGNTPSSVYNSHGKLWTVFEADNHIYVTSSDDHGKTFAKAVKVNSIEEKIYTSGENRPKIAIDGNSHIFITWTQKTSGRFSGNVRFSRSSDRGENFSDPVTINSDRRLIGHRFDSLSINQHGDVYIAWLDKRDKADASSKGETYPGTALYYAYSKDQGATFSANIKITDHTCECCRLASAVSPDGDLSILWRHIFEGNIRDHALTTITPDNKIMPVIRATHDEWKIDSCPHHGPDIIYGADHHLYYTWFTQSNNQQGILFAKYNTANDLISNINLADSSSSAAHPQLIRTNNRLIHAWKRFDGEQTLVVARYSDDHGTNWTATQTLSRTRGASDHPFLIKYREMVYLAWHTTDEGYIVTRVVL